MKKESKKKTTKQPVSKVKTLTGRGARTKLTAAMDVKDDVAELAPLSDAIGKAGAAKRAKPSPVREGSCADCSKPFKTTNPDATVCDKCAAKAAKKTAKKKEAGDAPRVEARLLVGDLSLPVDASDLGHTIGAGSWGHGRGLVDAWPDAAWAGLLAHLGLPAFPLDRAAAEQPVKRLVQRLWYEAIAPWTLAVDGERTEADIRMSARDVEYEDKYKAGFGKTAEAHEARAERAKTSFGKSGETSYEPAAALKDKKLKLGGQAGILLEAFRAAGFPAMTTREATDGMVKAGLKTATKPERIAAFYLCQWAKKGLVTRAIKEAA